MGTNTHDLGSGRFVGGEEPTRDDHLATKKYVDDHGGGTPVDVTDGTHTVIGLTELDFTSGATVTDAGGGVAQVAVGGGSQTVEVVTRPFTSAEILSLDTVPIELVPTPDPGFVLVPLNLVWVYRFVTTPYDQAGVANVDWTGGSLGLCAAEAALNRPEDRISYGYATTESRKVLTTAEDRGLVLSIDVPVVDGDGTGFAVLSYMTVPLA